MCIYITYWSSITIFSEKAILLGETGSGPHSNLTRYVIFVAKFAAWKERDSYQFRNDKKIVCLHYFRYSGSLQNCLTKTFCLLQIFNV